MFGWIKLRAKQNEFQEQRPGYLHARRNDKLQTRPALFLSSPLTSLPVG
jgi:hypothetical protein